MRIPSSARVTPLRSQAGFGLVEVLVSVVLLALVTLGVFAQIDGPAALSGANRLRSTAAALAQQDQERLRAMRSGDLANYSGTRTVQVGRVSYTVASKATWISDASGTESCTNNSSQANYLQIASTVTWPTIGSGKPIKAVSLMAPNASLGASTGNLAVQVTNQAGAVVEGLPVTVTPGTHSTSTNSFGCAFFPALAAGNYQASYSSAGQVDPSGAATVTLSGSVVSGATATLSGSLGQAAQTTVNFDTKVGSAQPVAAQSKSVTLVNPGIPAPGFRTFSSATAQASIAATALFPFASGYGAYAGGCSAANPTLYNASYYTQNPTRYANVTPGGSSSVTVREPALNVTVRRNSSAYNNAHVVVTATGTGCSDKFTMSSNSAGGLVKGAAPYDAPAVPFGTHTVCADDGIRRATVTVSNTDPSGNQASNTVLNIPTSGIFFPPACA
jgi:Tfp pilus assembly protein PilV